MVTGNRWEEKLVEENRSEEREMSDSLEVMTCTVCLCSSVILDSCTKHVQITKKQTSLVNQFFYK